MLSWMRKSKMSCSGQTKRVNLALLIWSWFAIASHRPRPGWSSAVFAAGAVVADDEHRVRRGHVVNQLFGRKLGGTPKLLVSISAQDPLAGGYGFGSLADAAGLFKPTAAEG